MSKAIERLRKRRAYPVSLEGEEVLIRALLTSEAAELMAIKDDAESFGFALGCALVNDDRSPVFTRQPNESPIEFGSRVLAEIDLPTDTRAELTEKILALSNGPKSLEQAVKN